MDDDTRRQIVLTEIERSEQTIDDPPPADVEPTQPGRAQSRVYTVRLGLDTIEAIEQLAAAREVPAAALVRGFVLEGLAAERRATVSDLVDSLQSDIDRLRRTLSTAGLSLPA